MTDEKKNWVYNLAKTKIEKAAQNNCEWLILERLGLSEIPEEVYAMDWLKELIVIDNLVETIPQAIAQLKNLTHLDLGRRAMSRRAVA